MTTVEWYKANACTHAHCPMDCEHPQPFMDGVDLICCRCCVYEDRRSVMVPCGPAMCD